MKKCWQNLLKVRIQCFMPSVQRPRVAGIRSLEEWNWNGQHLLLPKFWTKMWRNADKTFSKRCFSALCPRHRNLLWQELEVWKNEMESVNIYCCQKFGEWCEEIQMTMLHRKWKFGIFCQQNYVSTDVEIDNDCGNWIERWILRNTSKSNTFVTAVVTL